MSEEEAKAAEAPPKEEEAAEASAEATVEDKDELTKRLQKLALERQKVRSYIVSNRKARCYKTLYSLTLFV